MALKTNGHPRYRNDKIKAAMDALGWKDHHVAVEAGLSVLTIALMRKGRVLDPRLSTIDAIARAVKMDRRDLLEPWPEKKARTV